MNRKKIQQNTNTLEKSYSVMSFADVNEVVLLDFKNAFKNAVETLVTNKTELFKIYQNRKTDSEFLKIDSFKPVLNYVKFIEINKEYLNQIDPTKRSQALQDLYPDFLTNPRFYINNKHVQLFIILANDLQ